MSTVRINGQSIDLGEVGSASVGFHPRNAAQAEQAITAIAKYAGVWNPTYGENNGTVWATTTVDGGPDDAPVRFTVYFPSEVTGNAVRPKGKSPYLERAQEFALSIVKELGDGQ
jgi:hypothetical protein